MPESFTPRFVDLVRNYTVSTGVGDVVLGPAVSGYGNIAQAIAAGEQFYYTMTSVGQPGEREVGRATMLANGKFQREPTSGTKTNFSAGTKIVTVTVAGEWFDDAQQAVQQTVHQPLFTDIANLRFAPSVQRIQTCGRTVAGQNGAFYVRDPDQSPHTVAGQRMIDEDGWGAAGIDAMLAYVRIQDSDGIWWVIDDTGQQVHLGHFGGVADGSYDPLVAQSAAGTDNLSALQAFIYWRQLFLEGTPASGKPILVPPGTYRIEGWIDVAKPGFDLVAHGVTFVGTPAIYAGAFATNFTVRGLTLIHNAGSNSTYLFSINCAGAMLKETTWRKEPAVGSGYIGYFQQSTANARINNFTCSGSNGVYLGGNGHIIDGFDMTSAGGDDAWVIKATALPAFNIMISNGVARNYSSVLAIGSEIGRAAGTAGVPSYCRNVTVTNVIAQRCSYLFFIKPGSNSENDYTDGLVENVVASNCVLEDEAGDHFRTGIHILAGRGSTVRNLRFNNIAIRARAMNQAASNVGLQIAATAAGDPATIEDIFFDGISIVDPHLGAPTGTATPGYPIDNAVSIENRDTALGVIRRIEFRNVLSNGCRRSAFNVGQNVVGPVKLRGVTLRNYANNAPAGADGAAIVTLSPVDVKDLETSPSPAASPNARGVMSDGQSDKTIDIIGESISIPIASVTPGASVTVNGFTADRDAWIRRVELVTSAAIPQSDTNYVTITARNSNTGTPLVQVNTKMSGGLAFAANMPVVLNGANQLSGVNSILPKNARLMLQFSPSGTGQAVANPVFRIHYVPFGQS